MNIIYTWVKMDESSHSSKGWGNNFLDIAMISVSAANQYHHTKLYCDKVSKDLKNRGFKFVGSTVVYAHLQATGQVNDHVVDCFRYNQV